MSEDQYKQIKLHLGMEDDNEDLPNHIPSSFPKQHLNKIYNGDTMNMLLDIPDNSVDLVVTSPPYNINKFKNDRRPLEEYLKWQTEIIEQCHRVLKPSGSIFWQVGTYVNDSGAHIPLDIRFFPIFESLGMFPRNRIVWVRPHGLHANKKFAGRHETILWFTKTPEYKFFLDPIRVPQKYANKKHYKGDKKGELSGDPLGKNPGDVWAFRNVRHNHEEDTIHPTQYPEDMIERIVLSTTEPNDIVLDPFIGMGTTASVAKNLNRYFCGAEIEKEYVDIAYQILSGEPDENNNFPNLKTLRQYCEKNGIIDPSQYTFTRQRKGSKPSLDSKAHPEEHHKKEIVERIEFEAENSVYKKVQNEQ
ncbi:DNA-methyltransferase [Bacillus atrophaeus]|uniref:Methyltransferase n=1 Tax=Bacillus atrophaeus (strain 1942) TaxID=720555 RepID=A0ABM5M325_BACA1|nr:site-specific DNA-methyltransferase [Bacillus atrophaeus]ADP34534.1 DNA methylase N-4/N-6 domain-containing protein [Bacillus atrophaeus 1942]AIK47160.1 DNA methylase family protein [Bacillus atrophaeus subsp. globigii]EIM11424.1 DNA methylase N-4/N-6 domain-containing protein [Bacillus atrophaeus C89]KFK84297.1 DNA methylase family protein [Bacillus atrophaeus]MBG9759903.1 modification methylase [Bacillus atrophaeus]